ncbi:DUF6318 family protein [Nocardioides terrisoli]|uniref:DUF6318 family protein n=1 Tax=Nocardioides terrisoli TaxID=3388267 RepID=UPI00287B5FF7|nr:DUF6318 family protein [Nocardioides marmorisolisilvae]
MVHARSWRFAPALLCGLVCALTLAGCGNEPATSHSPSATPSGSASARPSPAIPPMPSAAKAHSKAGAVAFVRYYVTAFNHAQATGDVRPLRELGAKGCISCRSILTTVREIYSAGGHIEGGRWRMVSHEAHRAPNNQWTVDVGGRFAPSRTYSSDGAGPARAKGGGAVATFFVKYTGGWKVLRWTRAD